MQGKGVREHGLAANPARRGGPIRRAADTGPGGIALDRVHPRRKREMTAMVLESTLVCPNCGYAAVETMPADACVHFYECRRCRTMLRPKPGDCCVFCSFGSMKCPPKQAEVRAGDGPCR